MTDHPLTPPPELVQQWTSKAAIENMPEQIYIATQATNWGADIELEACCHEITWLDCTSTALKLRAARRPKPPSLAQRALHILGSHGDLSPKEHDTIRKALEKLND